MTTAHFLAGKLLRHHSHKWLDGSVKLLPHTPSAVAATASPTGDYPPSLRSPWRAADAPVPLLVRVGQRAAGNTGTYTHVVELAALGLETGFDIAQALALCKLSEGHAAKLLLATEALDVSVAAVALNAAAEGVQWQVVHCLRENEFACKHRRSALTRNTEQQRRPERMAGSSR